MGGGRWGGALGHIGWRQRAYVSGKMLVGPVGDGYFHEIDPQRQGRVAAAFFIAQRLTVVVANPHPAGDRGRKADEPGIVEVSGGACLAPERMMQRRGVRGGTTRSL